MEKYIGIRPESEAKNTPSPKYHHSETHGGREVKYYETWREETENNIRPAFGDNEEPTRRKIKAYDMLFRFFLAGFAAFIILKYF